MARREVPTRDVLKANQQKILNMHQKMQEAENSSMQCSNTDPFQSFQDHLTCIVCFDLAKDPFSCPKCQHICCRPCLEQWFSTICLGPQAKRMTKKVCPGCRIDLSTTDLSTNRLADQLIRAMQSQDRVSCTKHNSSELLFYCKTCEEPLCTDAIVEDPKHRQHEYIQINKIYKQAQQKINGLIEEFTDLREISNNVISKFEDQMIQERYKNEVKLAEFMKSVDEQLQQFQADEEKVCANIQGEMDTERARIYEIQEFQNRINNRLSQLSKIEIVQQAGGLIEEIQSSLTKFTSDQDQASQQQNNNNQKKTHLPKATSAEDLFNQVESPSIEHVKQAIGNSNSNEDGGDLVMSDESN